MADINDVKNYWNTRPCNIKHSPEPVGTKAYFDQVRQRKYFVEYHIGDFARFWEWSGKKVLEVGCGIGTDTHSFAEAGANITAVDLSENSLAIAKERMKVYGLNWVRFYQVNAEELSQYIQEEKYDLVYSFGVLHHTPHPERAFKEITKFMSPNSTFRLMVYHKLSWKVLWILFKYGHGAFWKLNKLIAENSEAAFGCPVTFAYTRGEITKILEKCGYKVISTKVDHIFPYKISLYKNYQYKKVWYFRWMPHFLFRAIEQNFGWHLLVEARLRDQA
jgi:ubiquinone/menaquinone biosynthesis C-methylase UbiE